MKLIILACLLGFAAASILKEDVRAVDGTSDDYQLDRIERGEMFDEMIKSINKVIDRAFETIKDSIDKGKDISKDVLNLIKRNVEKLKWMGIDLTKKIEDILRNLVGLTKEKLKEMCIVILGRECRPRDDTSEFYHMDRIERNIFEGLDKFLQELLNKALEAIIDHATKGKEMNEKLWDKLRDVMGKIKEFHFKLGEKAKELLKKLKELVNDNFKKIIDTIISPETTGEDGTSEAYYMDRMERNVLDELKEKLKEFANHLLGMIAENIEKGKQVSEHLIEKLREIYQKLKERGIDLKEKMVEHLKKIKGISDETLEQIMGKVTGKKSARAVDYMSEAYQVQRNERSIIQELIKVLQQFFDHLLGSMIEGLKKGKDMNEKGMNKLGNIALRLREFGIDVTKQIHDALKNVAGWSEEKIIAFFDKFLGKNEKRSLHDLMDYVSELKFRDLIEDIKQKVLSNEVVQKIREHIKNFVATNPVIQKMKEAILKLSDLDLRQFIKDLLHLDTSRDRRSVRDLYEKIKDYLESFSIELKEKWIKFGEWVKEIMGKGLDKMKEKKENIKFIAKELHKHVKDVSQEVLREGIDFLRPYKEDLGELWNQLKDSVKEVLGKDD